MTGLARGTNYSAGVGRRVIPRQGADPQEFIDLRNRLVNFYSIYRNRHMARMARNLWYTLGRQWIEMDSRLLTDSFRGYHFRDLKKFGYADRPRPVTNFIRPQVENEIARLGRKEFEPTIVTDSSNPTMDAAARLGKNLLKSRLKALHWAQERELFNYMFVVCGTAGLRSGWDHATNDLITVASPDAVQCQGCGNVLSSPKIHKSSLEAAKGMLPGGFQNTDTIRDVVPGPESTPEDREHEYVNLSHCPKCEGGDALAPFEVPPNLSTRLDMFGAPLGIEVPKGNTDLEAVSPFELHPVNGGIGVHPWKCRLMARAKPVDIDWLEERYPEFAEFFHPQPVEELMRVHPILGEYSFVGRHHGVLDQGIYDNHMMWVEFSIDPYVEKEGKSGAYRLNDGRYITMAGDIVLDDAPLMLTYKTHDGRRSKLPRVKYTVGRFGIRLGEYFGQSHVDDLISPQNRINARDSQLIQALDRMGSPNLLTSEGMELRGPEWDESYGSGMKLVYSIDMQNPQAKPEVLQGAAMPNEVWQERDRMKTDITDVGGGQEVEQGDIPTGLRTTSGLILAGDNAAQRRLPREREIKEAFSGAWSHQLHMLYALRTEEDTFRVDANGASFTEIKRFRGADLLGQYNVEVSSEAGVDKSVYTKEAAAEALTDQIYDLSDPVARRRYLELRGLPEINENINLQIDRARKAAARFGEVGEIPVPDPNTHDCGVWYNVLGQQWLKDELHEVQKKLGWDDILKLVAGWDKELNILAQMDMAARDYYRGVPPEQAQVLYDKGIEDQTKTLMMQKTAVEDAAKANLPMPVFPPPVPPPPEPVFISAAYEERVYAIFMDLMGSAPTPAPLPVEPPDAATATIEMEQGEDGSFAEAEEILTIEHLLRFYATMQAYRLYAEEKLGAGMAGAPIVGAPGESPAPGGAAGGGVPGEATPMLPSRTQNALGGGTLPQAGASAG